MRGRRVVSAAALVGALLASAALPAAATPTVTATATVKKVVRPVTSTGQVRAGWSVTNETNGAVDCSFADASPGAVSRNIEWCSPSAEYAIACWQGARPGHVLCLRDPSRKQLVRIPRTGRFAATALAPLARRAPLLLVLTDGTRCSIRDGGAWSTFPGHPSWFGSYSCSRHGIVWATPSSQHNGIDESRSSWTVRTAPFSGGTVVTRHVAFAYFVGTYSG